MSLPRPLVLLFSSLAFLSLPIRRPFESAAYIHEPASFFRGGRPSAFQPRRAPCETSTEKAIHSAHLPALSTPRRSSHGAGPSYPSVSYLNYASFEVCARYELRFDRKLLRG